MKKDEKIGRREFLTRTAVGSLGASVLLAGKSRAAPGETGKSSMSTKSSTGPMKRIAIEEHWGNRELGEIYLKWRARTGFPESIDIKTIPKAFPRLADFERYRLPLMDELGISVQVISIGSPGIQGVPDAAAAIDMAKKTNDMQAEIIAKYKGRFAGFAALPTQDPKAAADELERAVKELGFKGAMIQGRANWEHLDGPKHRVLWERAAGLEVPIYLHVNEPTPATIKEYEDHPELMGPTWSWGVETATQALRIIGSGLFDAYPKATLILGHLGESLPYLLGRLDEGYAMAFKARKLKKPLSEYMRQNALITTSGLYRPEALTCAIQAMGEDRVLFACDYPFVDPKESVAIFEGTQMSPNSREKIYHLNAERWLKM
jgi:2,3-dihydroxybenzoate decarboxylase